jgi:hypothetical protein
MDLSDTAPSGGASGQVESRGHDLRDEPIGELLKRLSNETTTLVKMELELAKAEMTQKGKQAGTGVGCSAAAASRASWPSSPSR